MELLLIDCVSLTPVPDSQRQIITNLMQLYKYDFSEFAGVGSRYGEVGPDGRFTYEGLDSYWREDGRVPLTVEADGRLAGFVLVNRWSALNRLLDHSVTDFFSSKIPSDRRRIARRKGLIRPLARALGGSCGRAQQAGSTFLEKGIRASVNGTVEEYAGVAATVFGERWVGTVLCFDSQTRKS